jgi:hypothetical protein
MLQVGFIAILVKSTQVTTSPATIHEIILVLSHIRETAAPIPLPSGAPPILNIPALTIPPLPQFPDIKTSVSPRAAAPDMRGIGAALFGCSSEIRANLPERANAGCPGFGAFGANSEFSGLLGGRSHVEDNEHWANALAHERSPLMLPCLGGLDVICLLRNVAGLADGSAFDPQSYLRDPEQWGSYVDADQFMPHNPDGREQPPAGSDAARSPMPPAP